MKNVFVAVVICLLLCGCLIKPGQGRSVGYITTIEPGALFMSSWDYVWFRVETGTYSSMQSQPDKYIINRNTNVELKEALIETIRKHQKIELIFVSHCVTIASSDVEVVGFKIID